VVKQSVAEGISVHKVALKIKYKVDYTGELVFDAQDGRCSLQTIGDSLLLGWSPATSLDDGLDRTIT